MQFNIFFNLLGLQWPFDIQITPKPSNAIHRAIKESGGSKILAIKLLRGYHNDYLGLKEAKDMIDKEWHR